MARRRPPYNWQIPFSSESRLYYQPQDYSMQAIGAGLEPINTEENNVYLQMENQPSIDVKEPGIGGGGMSKNPINYLQAVGTVFDFGTDIYNNTKSQVSLPSYTNYHAGNVNTLAGYNAMRQGPLIDESMANKPTIGEHIMDINKKTLQGASAGMSVGGPWGALAGGIVGTLSGIGNAFVKEGRYNKDVAKIRYYNDMQKNNYRIAQNQALNNVRSQRNMGINYQRLMNTYGLGGTVEPSELMGVTRFNAGGIHEGNPYGGIPIGMGDNGKQNLAEEGEVRWKDFIFSKRVKPSEAILKKYNTFMRGNYESYADLANKILDLHKEREDNPFDKATMNTQMQRLADAQEYEKLAAEAKENGMTPEEYTEYLQYAQQGQMAMGGNVFANGGGGGGGDYREGRKFRNGSGKDGMPIHGAGTKAYYTDNKSGNAWYIEKYLDALYGRMSNGAGFMWDKNGNRITYSDSDLNRYGAKVSEILQKDPDAVYYMYNRINEINNAFGNGQPVGTMNMPNLYNMGFIMDSLGNPTVMWDGSKYYQPVGGEMSTTPHISTYSGGVYGGLNVAPPVDKSVFGVNQAGTNTMRNTIEAEIEAYKQRSAANSYAKGGPYKSANNYEGDTWVNYLKYRDTMPEALEEFRKKYYPNYTTGTLLKNLKDNKWGPITDAFLKYSNDLSAQTVVEPKTEVITEEHTPVEKSTTPATQEPNKDASEVIPQYKVGNSLGFSLYDGMRLAPVFDSLRSVLEQNAPDYTYANQIASLYRPVSYRPVGQYARFMPIDQHYLDTMARQRQNTLYGFYRSNAVSPGAANYYATLAATIGGSQAAQAYRDSVLQNNQNRNSVLAMNNQIDAANEAARARTQQINYQNYANIMAQSYAAAEQERLAVEQAREANKQNLAANIGLVGRELSDRYYVSKNPALFYGPMGAYYKYIQEQNKKR